MFYGLRSFIFSLPINNEVNTFQPYFNFPFKIPVKAQD